MTFLQSALDLASRGFHVFPLKPRDKWPIVAGGYKAATRDPEQIALWWKRTPDANIGIACEVSQLCVVDCDHGFTCLDDFIQWRDRNGIPVSYAVRSGRRPEFGVQMYFRGPIPTIKFDRDGARGDIKSKGGLVAAPPSIHPDSGEAYEVLIDAPIAPTPEIIKQLKKVEEPTKQADGNSGLILENRNQDMVSLIGKLRHQTRMGEDACLLVMLAENQTRYAEPMKDAEVEDTVRKQYRLYPTPEQLPEITIDSKPEEETVADWRELFHSKEEALNAPPVSFLIKDFLQREGVTAIAAPVRERKSLIALNIVHALVTGEKLFGHFDVVKKPKRVLYLCPEVSLGPFTDRVKKIGLMRHVGWDFFYRTLSADGKLDLTDEVFQMALPGSVVFLDTAIRFLEGDENASKDVRAFADTIFSLLKHGAEAVVLLHHSPKDMGDSMTLESAMRGSGDMGAFLACCWGTRLQDPQHPYQSPSYLENLKQRDFESKPFEVTCGEDCRMRIVSDPSVQPATLKTRRGNPGNKDGKDAAAEAVIRADMDMTVRDLEEQLAGLGIDRRKSWVAKVRAKVRAESGKSGVKTGERSV